MERKEKVQIILGLAFFIMIIIYAVKYFSNESQSTEQQVIENKQTCLELMDMDFKSEQECIDFVRNLLGDINAKTDDPKVQELLKNYRP